MKSLYDKNFRYTEDAQVLAQSVSQNIHSIMRTFAEMGYNPREIAKLVSDEALEISLELILSKEEET